MNKLTIVFLIIVLFAACNNEPTFNTLPSGVEYCYVTENPDSVTANSGDVWILNVKYYNSSDSLLFNSKEIAENFTMGCPEEKMEGCIEEGLRKIHKCDSMIIKVDAEKFYKISCAVDVPDFIKKDEKLTFYVKCENIIDKENFQAQLLEFENRMAAQEKLLIHSYLERENISIKPFDNGIYKIVLTEGKGNETAANKTVKLNYIGSFIDGLEFDNSYNRGKPLEFKLGENLVIPGWEFGISTMKKGEKSKFIIPYNLAYGTKGYSGVIPPYSTLIFEVEMLDFK